MWLRFSAMPASRDILSPDQFFSKVCYKQCAVEFVIITHVGCALIVWVRRAVDSLRNYSEMEPLISARDSERNRNSNLASN